MFFFKRQCGKKEVITVINLSAVMLVWFGDAQFDDLCFILTNDQS